MGEAKVEYSFGYKLTEDGKLRISLHHSSIPYEHAITSQMVEDAQQAWAAGIVAIGAAYDNGTNATQAFFDHLADLYAYGREETLFKPALHREQQFRTSIEGALSYFASTGDVPGDEHISFSRDDENFASKLVGVRFENEKIMISGTTAVALGNYYFDKNTSGGEFPLEYAFGYKLFADGQLRVKFHHSSVPLHLYYR